MTTEGDKSWRRWVLENLQRGADRISMVRTLTDNGFPTAWAQEVMGRQYPPLLPPGVAPLRTPADYKTLAEAPFTRRVGQEPGLRKEPTNKAQLYIWEDFLTDEECDRLIAAMADHLTPSELAAPTDDRYFRTSETCYLTHVNDPVVSIVDQKIQEKLGLNLTYSERIQAQKYSVGQEFKAHTDFFDPGSEDYIRHGRTAGQRTWTCMINLDEGMEGGATRFTRLQKSFQPRKRRAVIWNNLFADGKPNFFTIHRGMPVIKGHKHIITKWFRDKGEGPLVLEA